VRRVLLLAVLAALTGAVTACSASSGELPQVTFAADGRTVAARPTQYCTVELTDCQDDADAPVELRVPPGTPVQVRVPQEVASGPWLIVFSIVSADGSRTDGRTPVFGPDQRTEYELTLPEPTDRLLVAEVHQLGAVVQTNTDTGEVEFPARATWVLNTSL
jgi:Protein of unknown function (DUF2771).